MWLFREQLARHGLIDHHGSVYGIAFSPDGTQLAAANDDATLRIWQTDGWVSLYLSFGHDDALTEVGAILGTPAWMSPPPSASTSVV